MKLALIQMNIAWLDREANLATAQAAIEKALNQDPDIALFVLPEMFSTGFTMEPQLYADRHCETLKWMQSVADTNGVAIAGSVAVKDGEEYYNRFYFVRPRQEVVYYDKHHLFSYSGENQHYTPGDKRVVVEWQGVRFMLIVCYDLRFPIWIRNNNDYDAILCIASWPESRRMAWDILLRARAIENQSYAFGVNRIGSDLMCIYNGGTTAVHPYGIILAEAPDPEENDNDETVVVTAEINMPELNAFRDKFPVLSDRD